MAGFTIKPTRQLLQERGLLEGGKVQKFIDSECIRHMDKYTPFQTGFLKRSVILGTVIGSGILRYVASYIDPESEDTREYLKKRVDYSDYIPTKKGSEKKIVKK